VPRSSSVCTNPGLNSPKLYTEGAFIGRLSAFQSFMSNTPFDHVSSMEFPIVSRSEGIFYLYFACRVYRDTHLRYVLCIVLKLTSPAYFAKSNRQFIVSPLSNRAAAVPRRLSLVCTLSKPISLLYPREARVYSPCGFPFQSPFGFLSSYFTLCQLIFR
jgi:hypothetical protein